MHDLHEHLTQSLAERLKKRRVVIWYDPRREFTAFISELAGGTAPEKCQLDSVEVSGKSTGLCVMQESFFEVKFAAETCVAGDVPEPLLIYIPGKDRHDDSAILMELELGGDRWEPQLKREARRVLKKRFGERISPAVKSSLESLLNASTPAATTRKKLTCLPMIRCVQVCPRVRKSGKQRRESLLEPEYPEEIGFLTIAAAKFCSHSRYHRRKESCKVSDSIRFSLAQPFSRSSQTCGPLKGSS